MADAIDPRLEAAYARLHAAQDRHEVLVAEYRAAERAYQRSRSQKNREALIAATEASEAVEDVGELYDEIDRIDALIAAEERERAEAAERALQPSLF
jgi:hypothetical protein